MTSSSSPKTKVFLEPLTQENIGHLQDINAAVLPVQYSSTSPMYKQMLTSGALFSYVAYIPWENDTPEPVGALGCRLEVIKDSENSNTTGIPKLRIVVMTLGVLPRYRRLKIGSTLMKQLMDSIEEFNSEISQQEKIVEILLHVQVSNEEAIEFYERLGFNKTGKIENYYKRVEPPHCFVFTKTL